MKKKRSLLKSKAYYHGPKSDHFDGERFFNPWNPKTLKSSDAIRWKLTAKQKPWPGKMKKTKTDHPPSIVEGTTLRISFVGHSTMLIQTESLNILTDPIWSNRASPFKWLGPKRVNTPGILLENLPKIDVILVSHNHYDHMDLTTLEKLWMRDHPKIISPLGNDTIINQKKAAYQSKHWIGINPFLTMKTLPSIWNRPNIGLQEEFWIEIKLYGERLLSKPKEGISILGVTPVMATDIFSGKLVSSLENSV